MPSRYEVGMLGGPWCWKDKYVDQNDTWQFSRGIFAKDVR